MKRLKGIKFGKLEQKKLLSDFMLQNNITLPSDYQYFLLNQNPYLVMEDTYRKNQYTYEIHHFYPLDVDNQMSVQSAYHDLNEFFENKYIAFADDSGGWQFVISVQEEDYGKVYFCRVDEELEDALTLLADSFEEFINGLQESSEE